MNTVSEVEKILQDYIGQKQKTYYYHKRKNDAEKEYNKLLVSCGGEEKKFSLEEANKIYHAFKEMQVNEELLRNAEDKFNEADEKLKELGGILFHASITADISIPPINGEAIVSKQVTVSFPNGQALVI
jgi:NADH dehydrogenase FAD-containing subunit